MDIDRLLTKLYEQDTKTQDLTKTAAENFIAGLRDDVAEENPYADVSTEDLEKKLQELETPDEEELSKVAAEKLMGEVMAHACCHELDLIKEAVSHGICRVCKERPMDVENSSICSACSK